MEASKNEPICILDVEELKVSFPSDEGLIQAVDGVSFSLDMGKTFGVVGESGCGKSVTALSLLRISPPIAKISGKINLHIKKGVDLKEPLDLNTLNPKGREIRNIRGNDIAMIFQEPMAAFSPVHTVGDQLTEQVLTHVTNDKKEATEIVIDMLDRVGISNPSQRILEYPQQLSGGMQQRAMIAMALSCSPNILIADEPTTALDVTVQAQVLELLKELQLSTSMAVMYITHDLGVIAEIADVVAVMYLGKIVEFVDIDSLFYDPLHPYTKALIKSIPKLNLQRGARLEAISGSVPTPVDLPQMCYFYPRCNAAMQGLCDKEVPPMYDMGEGHQVRCFLYR